MNEPRDVSKRQRARGLLHIARLQDRLATLLGCEPATRPEVLAGMLKRGPTEAMAYWLQLTVAVGIATFGLVLDSTAVVIGAMLIAPLMGPIVGLGMGLAVGSPFLVLRALGRVVVSMAVAVGGAALITNLLPFSELTSEIAARIAPTALDLCTAAFCAVAGAYASLRPGSGTATTAAGTSIGISLVPPLCASGYGVGTAQWEVASGAALLFTANFAAIVVVGTCAFVAAGFNRLNVAELEARELEHRDGAPLARALARRLARVFASPGGPVMRMMLPFVLLLGVYVPLRRALDEVAWQMRVRSLVTSRVGELAKQVVQSRLRVERGEVELRMLLVGSTEEAERVKSDLMLQITRIAGVAPQLEVLAMPDAKALSGLAAQLHDIPVPAAPTVEAPKIAAQQIAEGYEPLKRELERLWPVSAAGKIVRVMVSPKERNQVDVLVVHLGSAADSAVTGVLARSLSQPSLGQVSITTIDVPETLDSTEDLRDFALRVATAFGRTDAASGIAACIEQPVRPSVNRKALEHDWLLSQIRAASASHDNVRWFEAPSWRVSFVLGECKPPASGSTPTTHSDASD